MRTKKSIATTTATGILMAVVIVLPTVNADPGDPVDEFYECYGWGISVKMPVGFTPFLYGVDAEVDDKGGTVGLFQPNPMEGPQWWHMWGRTTKAVAACPAGHVDKLTPQFMGHLEDLVDKIVPPECWEQVCDP